MKPPTFTGIEADIVNGIMNAGNKYLQYAEETDCLQRIHLPCGESPWFDNRRIGKGMCV